MILFGQHRFNVMILLKVVKNTKRIIFQQKQRLLTDTLFFCNETQVERLFFFSRDSYLAFMLYYHTKTNEYVIHHSLLDTCLHPARREENTAAVFESVHADQM